MNPVIPILEIQSKRGQIRASYSSRMTGILFSCKPLSYITSLETSGKLEPEDAYKQIKALWKQLKHSKKALFIGEEPPEKS
ncbi:hypothetical protein FD724_30420 [Nostoc sp. C057]|uniref:DUF7219 family protein n=1 Tax=Nostoc sp. C057 TaxID=2576903 RepID=UPI0015C3D501|nr:hypothetical protein [Nostoc sp. C057]QLE51939.1 hypothetical protein FD724_30420 [Nostoc sp. C057]